MYVKHFLLLALGSALLLACGSESEPEVDDEAECQAQLLAHAQFVRANQSCETAADCTELSSSCSNAVAGNCMGTTPVNSSIDLEQEESLAQAARECLGMCTGGCAGGVISPVVCDEGRCAYESEQPSPEAGCGDCDVVQVQYLDAGANCLEAPQAVECTCSSAASKSTCVVSADDGRAGLSNYLLKGPAFVACDRETQAQIAAASPCE